MFILNLKFLRKFQKNQKILFHFVPIFITLRDERKLVKSYRNNRKNQKLKEEAEKIAKADVELTSKIETEFNLSEQLNGYLQEQFEILKNDVKNESLEKQKINFRLYFPSVKNKKTIRALTIIDEMDFDIFC